ncbi:MAG: hypothetical protein HOE08_02485 [Campylobacteraceae bacterium]|jgi:hypothetical protein|nr:hypothetical protein [Campylobacteraceae bacterium]
MMMNKKQFIIAFGTILVICILLLIFVDTDSAIPEFDKYHEDNKHLIERSDFYDDGASLKKDSKEE